MIHRVMYIITRFIVRYFALSKKRIEGEKIKGGE